MDKQHCVCVSGPPAEQNTDPNIPFSYPESFLFCSNCWMVEGSSLNCCEKSQEGCLDGKILISVVFCHNHSLCISHLLLLTKLLLEPT